MNDGHWFDLDPMNAFSRIPKLEDPTHPKEFLNRLIGSSMQSKLDYRSFRDSVIVCRALNRERRLVSKVIKAHRKNYNIAERVWNRAPLWNDLYDDVSDLCKIKPESLDAKELGSVFKQLFAVIGKYVDNHMFCRVRLLGAILRIADGLDYAIERIPYFRSEKDLRSNIDASIDETIRVTAEMELRLKALDPPDKLEYSLNASVSHITIDAAAKRIVLILRPLTRKRIGDMWEERMVREWWSGKSNPYSLQSFAELIQKRINAEFDSVSDILEEHGITRYEVKVLTPRSESELNNELPW
jgi:hypothetical protein